MKTDEAFGGDEGGADPLGGVDTTGGADEPLGGVDTTGGADEPFAGVEYTGIGELAGLTLDGFGSSPAK